MDSGCHLKRQEIVIILSYLGSAWFFVVKLEKRLNYPSSVSYYRDLFFTSTIWLLYFHKKLLAFLLVLFFFIHLCNVQWIDGQNKRVSWEGNGNQNSLELLQDWAGSNRLFCMKKPNYEFIIHCFLLTTLSNEQSASN